MKLTCLAAARWSIAPVLLAALHSVASIAPPAEADAVKAFPTAEWFGAEARGGAHVRSTRLA